MNTKTLIWAAVAIAAILAGYFGWKEWQKMEAKKAAADAAAAAIGAAVGGAIGSGIGSQYSDVAETATETL